MQDGISEAIVEECESIMQGELALIKNQLEALQIKHIFLLNSLKRLETEKVALKSNAINEITRRLNGFYPSLPEGIASDLDFDNQSQYNADVETDGNDGILFEGTDFSSAASLISASYQNTGNSTYANSFRTCEGELYFSGNLGETEEKVKAIEFPFIERRNNLPEPKEKEKRVSLWPIIKDHIGKDLSGVCLPVCFSEPLSSLQKCFEDFEYSHLVDRALACGKQGNDLMRILNVAAFAVSGYASTKGRQWKPFNPILGETYEADYPDKGLRFLSEKVSHHPTIVAFHCDGRCWQLWADYDVKAKFWGQSIQLDPVGIITLQFDDGEMFQWSKVMTSIHNITSGKNYSDHYGIMRIEGNGTYSCKLKFKEESIIDHSPHQVQGLVQDNRTGENVAILLGKWDEAIYYVIGDPATMPKGFDPMTEAILLWERDKVATKTRYNLTPFAISLNELTPDLCEKLPPTDSRLRPDQRHVENGEYELADAEKLRLDHLQRQARKFQDRSRQPRWFRKDEDGCYRYIGGYWEARDKGNWDGIPDIFGYRAVQ